MATRGEAIQDLFLDQAYQGLSKVLKKIDSDLPSIPSIDITTNTDTGTGTGDDINVNIDDIITSLEDQIPELMYLRGARPGYIKRNKTVIYYYNNTDGKNYINTDCLQLETMIIGNETLTEDTLELLSGSNTGTSITIDDTDKLIINDGGIMKQILASDFKNYISVGSSGGTTLTLSHLSILNNIEQSIGLQNQYIACIDRSNAPMVMGSDTNVAGKLFASALDINCSFTVSPNTNFNSGNGSYSDVTIRDNSGNTVISIDASTGNILMNKGSKKLSLNAPDLVNDVNFTFPKSNGISGQFLSVGNNGETSWSIIDISGLESSISNASSSWSGDTAPLINHIYNGLGNPVIIDGATNISGDLRCSRIDINDAFTVANNTDFNNSSGSYADVTIKDDSGNTVVTIDASTGDIYSNSNIMCQSMVMTSDRRLKENIQTIENTICDKLLQLEPSTFTWKHDSTHKNVFGFIAQDVQDIYPELINNKDGLLRIDYVQIIPLLVHKIKYMNHTIEEMRQNTTDMHQTMTDMQHTMIDMQQNMIDMQAQINKQ